MKDEKENGRKRRTVILPPSSFILELARVAQG